MTAADNLHLVQERSQGIADGDPARSAIVRRVRAKAAETLGRGAGDLRDRDATAAAVDEAITNENLDRLKRGEDRLTEVEHRDIAATVCGLLAGLGVLDDYLADDEIENIDANGPHDVFITRAGGRRERGASLALSQEQFIDFIRGLAVTGDEFVEHRFDPASPILAMSVQGHRVTAVLGGEKQRGVGKATYLSVRRHRRNVRYLDLPDFVANRTLTEEAAQFLDAAAKAALSTVIAGPANAGKTTLTRAMAQSIDPSERLVTIENVPELHLGERRENVVALVARNENVEGEGRVTTTDLLPAALRLNPSRIFLGELLPGDDFVLLCNALSSGHDGSMSTLHSRSSDIIPRLVSYALQSPGVSLDPRGSLPLIASAIDLAVYISKRGDRRFVSSIRLFAGIDEDGHIQSDELFAWKDGELVPHGGISRLDVADALSEAGYTHRAKEWR
jgi:pilus assembly protein CpaF